MFLGLSDIILKDYVFTEPDIRKLISKVEFKDVMNDQEWGLGVSFKVI